MSKSSITIEAVRLPAIHPGEILAGELEEIGISVAALSRAIDVPQSRMSEIIHGRRALTADTALRLGRYFGNSARFWMNLQAAYDLAMAEAANGQRIAAVVRPHAA